MELTLYRKFEWKKNEYTFHASLVLRAVKRQTLKLYLFLKTSKFAYDVFIREPLEHLEAGFLVDMVWNNVIVFWTFIFEWKSFICFKLVIWMDCPQYICITNRHILTMGAFLLLFLCSVQGFSSAVQTYSELIYPVPRHKVRNLENPEPQLSPESFQCSKVSISSGLCMCLSYFLGYHTICDKLFL